MIKAHRQAGRDAFENIMAGLNNVEGSWLSVNHLRQIEQIGSEMQGYGLMSKADAEDGLPIRIFPDDPEHSGLLFGQSGPGRKNDLVKGIHFLYIHLIRLNHIKTNFAVITQKFNQVEGEGIMVIEQQYLHEQGGCSS